MGSGAGAFVAPQTAKRDASIAAVLCLELDPATCGIPVRGRLRNWDGRPIGLLCAGKSAPAGRKEPDQFTLKDCGGFVQAADVACYEIWLSPRVLGVKPFSKIAVASCPARKGKPTWDPDGRADPENPQTWTEYNLR